MSDIRAFLRIQIGIYEENLKMYRGFLEDLPKGSIHQKAVDGRVYFYLKYRDNGKYVDKYIKQCELDSVRKGLAKRKEYSEIITALEEDLSLANRLLKLK